MKQQIDPYANGKFNTGYDERADRTSCGKALFLHLTAADDVDERETEPAGECHGGVCMAPPENFNERVQAAAGDENKTVVKHTEDPFAFSYSMSCISVFLHSARKNDTEKKQQNNNEFASNPKRKILYKTEKAVYNQRQKVLVLYF